VQDEAPSNMSSRWHIGAKQLRGPIAAYAKRFDLLEVRVTVEAVAERRLPRRSAPLRSGVEVAGREAMTPSLATLRRWRRDVPPHFQFAVVAGPHLARARPTGEADKELVAARQAIDVLQARCFVLPTPPEVTPTVLWRERIAKVIAGLPHDATHFVWEPHGVWDLEDAATQAHRWGAILAVDPVREAVPAGTVAYVRLRALGETHAFGPAALERAINAVGARREVFAVVETDSALAEAKRLRRLLRQLPTETVSGGKLARPRRSIVVGDDEQE
jgi:uncharacterized protein YecE (DUF72 family)